MKRERWAALVLGLLMIGSILGFASMSVRFSPKKTETGPVIDRMLSPEEKAAILRTGKVLIEYGYQQKGTKAGLYLSFVQKYPQFAVLEIFPSNQTIDQLIGNQGRIIDLHNVTQESELFRIFCDNAVLKPKECLLESF